MKSLLNLKERFLFLTWKNRVVIPVDYDFYDMLIFKSDLEVDDNV